MFKKIRELGLSTFDKMTQRANTLFTSMKDKEEERKSNGLSFSLFSEDEKEERLKRIEQEVQSKTKTIVDKEQQEKDKMQKRADILYSDSKIGNKIDKKPEEKGVDVFKGKEETKEERSKRLREENEEYLKKNAHVEQFTVDHIDNRAIKMVGKKLTGEEAAENLRMSKTKSYMDTKYAKKHKVYNNYNEAPNNLKKYFKDKITQQIGEDKLDKTKGIFIDENSESSKSLKNNLLQDKDFIDKLKNYDKDLKNNAHINDSINLKGSNWHNAVGNSDIRDMHINKNGDIELYVTDVYDFNEGEKNKLVRIGRNRQDKGEITPYFSAYRVIISKEEKDKILKGNK